MPKPLLQWSDSVRRWHVTHIRDVASGENTELDMRAGTWGGEGDGRVGWSRLPKVTGQVKN